MARNVTLSLDTLRMLECGKLQACFDHVLKELVNDCMNRPLIEKKRELTMRFELTPVSEGGSNGDRAHTDAVEVKVIVGSKQPGYGSRSYQMQPQLGGKLRFNPDLPDDPLGSTMFDEEAEREDARP